jgi:SNF2 family DNA or RNA helicase
MDEAHELIPYLKKVSLEEKKNIFKCKKLICMTGTPIYNHYTDLFYLINFVAMKDLIPL